MTSISESAFSYCTGLTTITIPNSVTSIGSTSFLSCTGLTSIAIPNSVTSIGSYAFQNCSDLTSITIPNSVTSIGISAFSGCSSLAKAEFAGIDYLCMMEFADWASNPLTYAHHLFINGEEVKDLVIPANVTSIGGNALSGCSGLTTITIPNNVTSIGDHALSGCSGLTTITIPNSVTSIGDNAFRECLGLTSITIPNSVESIGNEAFSRCTGLTTVSIGCGVTSIGSRTFAYCSELVEIFCYAEIIPYSSNIFRYSDIQYATLHVPADLIGAYRSTAPWNEILNIVPIEGEIPKVNKCATPTIEYSNGNVICNCETDGVKYIYQIAPVTVQRESESGRFAFAPTYEIKVYAKREGYKDSDTVSLIVSLTNVGDVNGDGQVSIADVTSLVNAILGK